jgi:branched-chain amino acid aminotransferase
MQPTPLCWLDGQVHPSAEGHLAVDDHGLLYGDGVFEGIRFRQRRCFRLDAHLRRLQASARALDLRWPIPEVALRAAIAQVLSDYAANDGYLRVILTRGSGPLGLDPRTCSRARVIILVDQLSLVRADRIARGLRLCIAATRRGAPDVLDARIKSLNYLPGVLARLEAHQAGADEAVLLNAQGRLAECTAANLFVVSGGRLQTPALSEGPLAGITRSVLLELAGELGIPAEETALTPYDLLTADEGLICGTGAGVIPIAEVQSRPLPACPGPIFERLSSAYQERVATETGA